MHYKRLISALGIGSALVLSSIMLTECTPMVTEAQLAQLQELRRKERSIGEEISKKKTELTKLESELNSRNAELKKCKDEMDFVKGKLSAWPNVWPDYTPEQPAPIEEPIKKK